MVGLTLSTVVEGEALVRSSKRRPKPTMKVRGEDSLSPTVVKGPNASSNNPQKADAEPKDNEEEEPSTIRRAFYY